MASIRPSRQRHRGAVGLWLAAAGSIGLAIGGSSAAADVAAPCGDLPAVQELLQVLNAPRLLGTDCDGHGIPASRPALHWSDRLAVAAAGQANRIAGLGRLSHGAEANGLARRLDASDYAYVSASENLAAGVASVAEALALWMASSAHCANLMAPRANEAALACVATTDPHGQPGLRYWVLLIGEPARTVTQR